jgi:hypothetical protein
VWKVIAFLAVLLQPIHVTSFQLWNEYRADEAKADAKYRDKLLSVTGKVREISATYTIYLEGGNGAENGVVTRWAGAEVGKAGSIRVGDRLTLVCTGAGLVFKEPILLECRFP